MGNCAKCGRNMGWLENRAYWNNQLKKGSIHWFQIIELGEVIEYKGPAIEFPQYKDKKICEQCAIEIMKEPLDQARAIVEQKLKQHPLCENCGYFETITHDRGGVDSLGTYFDESYDTYKCRKFGFDLDRKGENAQRCSSFISEREYQNKCLSGEMDKDKAKENVQVMLDFSSLRDVLSKGGLVMSAYNCPNCNAMIDIPEAGKILICKFCGTPVKAVDIFEKVKSLIQ